MMCSNTVFDARGYRCKFQISTDSYASISSNIQISCHMSQYCWYNIPTLAYGVPLARDQIALKLNSSSFRVSIKYIIRINRVRQSPSTQLFILSYMRQFRWRPRTAISTCLLFRDRHRWRTDPNS